ncbi:SCYL2 protein, partial [Polypterus senegalus]|nr:SCYL2 protein [Polypterus senegalus]
MQNIYFSCNDISRLKAVRLCQLLMDSKVFEPVGGKLFRKEKDMVFEDAHCSFYRFLDCDALPGSFKRVNTENMSPEYLHVKKKKKNSLEKITISNPLALESSDRRIEKLLQMINLRPLVPANSTSESSTSLLSKQVVEGIWRQQTLLHLLQLIELPILDGILASSVKLEQRNTPFCNQDGLIISNTFVDRVVSQSLQLSESDMWLSAAIDCLDLFPDQMLVTIEHLLYKQHANEKENLEAKKRLLFDTIAKYYNRDCDPLMTSQYFNIHSGIVDLLENGKIQQALEASQLCFRLLEPNVRDELRRLLAFMNFAADPDAFKLHKQHENSGVVCRTFARAVIRNASLSKTQTDLLLKFLMNNHSDLFKTPVSLIDTVRKKLHSLHHGMDPDELGDDDKYKPACFPIFGGLRRTLSNDWPVINVPPLALRIGGSSRSFSVCLRHGSSRDLIGRGRLAIAGNDIPKAAEIMESMLNKLKNTVTKVTADVTSAVMGNPVTREFEVGRHIASGGPGLSWKIFNGIKKSTKQEVAVFVFDKKIIEKYQKFDKDQITDSLKRGVQQLTRLRHPRLLTVQHPLEESRDCLAFCTEPVFASLSNVLGQWDNLPTPVPPEIKEHKLYDVETKYGLLQISEGLSFLHSSVKMVHGNLTSENIIINKSGAWKIMGFDFSISSTNPSEQELSRLNQNILQKVPEDVFEHVKLLLNVTPTVRPDADQMTKRVVVQRILPALTSEFVNPDMVPFVLPNVLFIAEECTKEEYIKLILPELTPVFKQQEPIQILLIFLQKMDLLLTKTPPEEIKNCVLPMVYRALEAPSIQIQELCLNIIPTFANLIDYPSMKNSLIPRIKNACLQTSSLAVSIYKCTFTHKKLGIPKEQLAGKVIPHLIPLSIDNNLNLHQFSSYMSVVKDMLNRVEAEHKTKLEQLHLMQEQQKGMDLTNHIGKPEDTQTSPCDQIEKIFGTDSVGGSDKKENGSSVVAPKLSRVSLTLEEKQRLAKEQEQAQKLKNQQPLAPKNITSTPTIKPTKDLTSTLLDNMSGLGNKSVGTSKPASSQMAPNPPFTTLSPVGTMSNGFSSMGFQSSGMNLGLCNPTPNIYSSIAPTNSAPNFSSMSGLNQPGSIGMPQQNKQTDMSALDSLFGPQKPKVSLNQMSQKQMQTAPSPWLNQFVPPQSSQSMAAAQPALMGQTGFGIQANPFFSPQNFSQPSMPKNTLKSSTSANNDLKDLFG